MLTAPKLPGTVRDLIYLLGGPTAVAALVGTGQPNVSMGMARGYIPKTWLGGLSRETARLSADYGVKGEYEMSRFWKQLDIEFMLNLDSKRIGTAPAKGSFPKGPAASRPVVKKPGGQPRPRKSVAAATA